MADVLGCIDEGISQISGTLPFHMGIRGFWFSGLVRGQRYAAVGKDFVRVIKSGEVTDFGNDHCSHTAADTRDGKNRGADLFHDSFDF